MPRPSLPETVRRELLRRGLPAAYADRLAGELADHLRDSGDDPTALGDPAALAAEATAAYRAGSFAGRHPVWAFLVLPVLAALVGWNLYVLSGIRLVESVGEGRDPFSRGLAAVLVFASRFAVPLAVVWGLWRTHRGCGRGREWFAAGTLGVLLLAALYRVEFTPTAADGEPELLVTLAFHWSAWAAAQAAAVGLFAAALAARPPAPAAG